VPAANCDDAPGGDNGSMRLVRVATLKQAISSIKAWTDNHDAPLPTCAGTTGAA
jgi:PDZ domain-containing protein